MVEYLVIAVIVGAAALYLGLRMARAARGEGGCCSDCENRCEHNCEHNKGVSTASCGDCKR